MTTPSKGNKPDTKGLSTVWLCDFASVRQKGEWRSPGPGEEGMRGCFSLGTEFLPGMIKELWDWIVVMAEQP